jgi:hypothetical protein
MLDWAVIWGERRKAAAAQAKPASINFNGGGNNYSVDQIEEIVRNGPPGGVNRSDTFHMVVGHYLGCGWDIERILAHLEQHPHGIGERYLRERRLDTEIARSASKYVPTALSLSDNGGWSRSWKGKAPQPETLEISPDAEEQHVPQEPCQESLHEDPELLDDDLLDEEDLDNENLGTGPAPCPRISRAPPH